MKHVAAIIVMTLVCTVSDVFAVETETKILSKSETAKILTDKVRARAGIVFPVFKSYSYKDRSGEYLLVLTERKYKEAKGKLSNDVIKGYCLQKKGNSYILKWKMQDLIYKENKTDSAEYSISFWTKYFDLRDFDNDGLIDPIIIYGTVGLNGTDDGRVKILAYYKGKKYGIRHQNGVLDFERNTTVDNAYYSLPVQIRKHVRKVMVEMTRNGHAIFPREYERNMDKKKKWFDEGSK